MKKSIIATIVIALAMLFTFANVGIISAQQTQTIEDQFWDAVKNSTKTEDFKSYLNEYPNGKYAAIARLKMGNGSSSKSFLSFKTSTAMTNEAFMERWESQLIAQLPINVGNTEIYRAAAPTLLEDYFYIRVRTQSPLSPAETRNRAGLLKTELMSEYCQSEAAQRKITVVLGFTENTGNTYATHLSPNDCPTTTVKNQAVFPVSASLTLQSGIQKGANGRNRIPVNRNDPAYTVEKLDMNPAIYLDVKFSDGTKIGPHDYHKLYAGNVIFDDVSGDPNDLIQVSYWDIDSNNPSLGKFAAQLTSTGKGTGTAFLKVSLRNAPNVSGSVLVEVVSGNAQNSAQETDAEFLNKWAGEVRVGLPEWIAGFQLINAWSRCPAGCQEKDSPQYLLLKFNAEGEQQYADIADLEMTLKPALVTEYCKSDAIRRNIMLGVFFDNRAQNQKVNFWVDPKDCPTD